MLPAFFDTNLFEVFLANDFSSVVWNVAPPSKEYPVVLTPVSIASILIVTSLLVNIPPSVVNNSIFAISKVTPDIDPNLNDISL